MNFEKTLGMFFVVLGLVGCSDDDGLEGNGQLQSEARTVEQFVRVDNRASYDVEIRPGSDFSVTVQIDANLLPLVQTSVENGTLILAESEPMDPELDDPHVIVTLPLLEQVIVSGRGDVDVTAFDHPAPVRLTVQGEGDIDFDGTAPDIIVEDNGPGEIEIRGVTAR